MMLATYTDTTLFAPPIQAISTVAQESSPTEMPLARRAFLAFAVLSTTVSLGIQASAAAQPETARVYIQPLGWSQTLNPDRSDLRLIARIRELGTYHEGWDGRDGKAACPEAIEEAEAFARALSLEEMYTPYISLAADGEINFFWDRDGLRIDLGFYGTGVYSYYIRLGNGQEYFGDDIAISGDIPGELLSALQRDIV